MRQARVGARSSQNATVSSRGSAAAGDAAGLVCSVFPPDGGFSRVSTFEAWQPAGPNTQVCLTRCLALLTDLRSTTQRYGAREARPGHAGAGCDSASSVASHGCLRSDCRRVRRCRACSRADGLTGYVGRTAAEQRFELALVTDLDARSNFLGKWRLFWSLLWTSRS